MALADKKEVIKHSAAIQITNEVNLLQRRTWNILLANAYDDLEKQDEFSVPIRELCAVLRYGSRNDKHLKQLLRELVDIKVEWNVLEKDKQEWGIAVLLAQAQIINGVLTYGYAPVLRKKLHNPDMYAKISLSLQNKFDSKHALALYELAVDYFDVRRGHGETPWMTIADFRKLMGVGEDEYVRFKDLSRYVVQKAVGEINDRSDLQVAVDYKKENRWVRAVKFRIRKNPREVEDAPALPIPNPQMDLELDDGGVENTELLETLEKEFGIHRDTAIGFLKSKDEFYIEEVLATVRDKIKAGKVDDVPAYTVRALEKDYRKKKTAQDRETEEKKKQAEQSRKDQELVSELKSDFEKSVAEKAQKAYQRLGKLGQQDLLAEFEKERIPASSSLMRAYHKGGMESHVIQGMCHGYMREKLLSDDERDFVRHAKKHGHTLRPVSGDHYEVVR